MWPVAPGRLDTFASLRYGSQFIQRAASKVTNSRRSVAVATGVGRRRATLNIPRVDTGVQVRHLYVESVRRRQARPMPIDIAVRSALP
jgi:hypothetical protein